MDNDSVIDLVRSYHVTGAVAACRQAHNQVALTLNTGLNPGVLEWIIF